MEKSIDPSDANPFRYCGEYYDKESGNVYLRARYYDSGIGRFTNEDPIKDGVNWYVYCGNNPVNAWDHTGLTKEGDERLTSEETEVVAVYTQMWWDADTAYNLGIITIEEKDSLQLYAESKADAIRYAHDHPFKTAFTNVLEFAIFDIALGDFGVTAYASDFTQDAANKVYGDEKNYSTIISVSAVYATDKGRNLINEKINGDMVRVDIEFPQGGKKPNLHVQNKQTGEKWMINSLDDIEKLPKSIRKNSKIIRTLKKGLKVISKLV